MEIHFTEIMLLFLCVASMINLLMNIAIAGSISKVVAYLRGDFKEVEITKEESNLPSGPLYQMRGGELVEIGGPTYDQEVFKGEVDPYSDGVSSRPATKNWDGVS